MLGEVAKQLVEERLPSVVLEGEGAKELAGAAIMLGMPVSHAIFCRPLSGRYWCALKFDNPTIGRVVPNHPVCPAPFSKVLYMWKVEPNFDPGAWLPQDLRAGPLSVEELVNLGEFGRLSKEAKEANLGALLEEKRQRDCSQALTAFNFLESVYQSGQPLRHPFTVVSQRLQYTRPYGTTTPLPGEEYVQENILGAIARPSLVRRGEIRAAWDYRSRARGVE